MKLIKVRLILVLMMPLIAGCASIKPVGHPDNRLLNAPLTANEINFPPLYLPENATFYVHNVINVDASPEIIWNLLIDAEAWPEWYEGAFDVSVSNSATELLEPNSKIDWNTMGLDFTSEIKEFEPPYRLAWESRRRDIIGYHAWLLTPNADGGTRVITDEVQYGFLAFMQSIFLPSKLRKLHDVWLTELKRKAESYSQ